MALCFHVPTPPPPPPPPNGYSLLCTVHVPQYRVGKAEESDNKWWYVGMLCCIDKVSGISSTWCYIHAALLIPTIFFYVVSSIGIILLYVFFTEVSHAVREN